MGLMDVASMCVGVPVETWRATRWRGSLMSWSMPVGELDRLANDASYEQVRPHLWIQLDRGPTTNIVQRPSRPIW